MVTDKTHHVLDQMPEQRHLICERMRADAEFRLLCEDFGEAFEALRHWEDFTASHRAERIAKFRQLLSELKAEILAELEAT